MSDFEFDDQDDLNDEDENFEGQDEPALPYYIDDVMDFLTEIGYDWSGLVRLKNGTLFKVDYFDEKDLFAGDFTLMCGLYSNAKIEGFGDVGLVVPISFPCNFKINLFEFKRLDKDKNIVKDYSIKWQNYLLEYYNPLYSDSLKQVYLELLKTSNSENRLLIYDRIDEIEAIEQDWEERGNSDEEDDYEI